VQLGTNAISLSPNSVGGEGEKRRRCQVAPGSSAPVSLPRKM
jgi:hypothetical protein